MLAAQIRLRYPTPPACGTPPGKCQPLPRLRTTLVALTVAVALSGCGVFCGGAGGSGGGFAGGCSTGVRF